jgi:outer membrane receptor protein involved in Fe transport
VPKVANVFLYLIYLVIISGLLVSIILSFHTNKVAAPAAKPVTKAASHTGVSPVTVTNNQSAVPANSAPSSQPATASGQLSNTGPGNVIVLFIGSALGGSLLYRHRLLAILK